jgi:hypothetical protein
MQGCGFSKPWLKKGSSGILLLQRSKAGHLPTGLLLHSASRSVGTEPGDFARPSETSRHFVCNTRPVAFGLKKRVTFHSETVLKLQKQVKQPKKGLL